ncbi:MAG TPA: amino acid adenylation domain-containing protein, partial [Thermoanaerobaculia bacterium]|nr:amino acid adenylation domain-containing protein [Thermoanaerobaculia bacterium]
SPETPAERILAEVVEEVLGVHRTDLLDSFFGLGGDSIKAIRLRALAERRGLRFPLEEVFRHGSLRELARAAAPAGGATPEPGMAPYSLIAPADRERLPAGVEDAYPLSHLQAGMIFHHELSGSAGLYHNVLGLHLRIELDAAALRWALTQLATRHPVLRTSFDLERFSEPLQLVQRQGEIPLALLDLTALPAGRQQELLARRFTAAGRPFDLRLAPLLRFEVCRLGPGSCQLLMAEHHAILDGWSVATLLAELFQLYLFRRGEAPALAAAPAPLFRDFVARERQTLETRESRDFWQASLHDRPSTVFPRWPLAGPVKAVAGYSPRPSVRVPVDASLSASLKRLARVSGLPLKSLLLAVHLKVLSASLGPDVITGLVANGRPEVDDGDRALGLFLNTLPFRLCLAPGSWLDLARQTLDAERALLPHRRYPLSELQRSLGDGAPLFEAAFNFVHFHTLDRVSRLGGLDVEGQGAVAETNFPLAVGFHVAGESQLALSIAYDPGRFPAAEVQALAGRFLRALADLSLHAEGPHSAAPLLAAAEEHQLLHEWNDAAAELGPDLCLHELFTAQADRRPDAIALIADEASLTYGELARQAAALAGRLRSLGVGPEIPVGLHLERSFELLTALLAVLEAGGAYVPLDPAFPRQRLAFQLADSGARLLLTRGEEGASLAPQGVRVLSLHGAAGTAGWAGGPGAAPEVGVHPDGLAYVIYTSGSTGRPNGVLLAHRGAVNLIRGASALLRAGPESRVLQLASPGFDAAVLETFVALANGASLCLVREEERRRPDLLAARVVRDGVTLAAATPSQLALLPEPALGGLRTLIIGGEAFPEDLARRWAPGRRLLNAYGPTEATIFATAALLGEAGAPAIGRPVPNLAAHVLDAALAPLPIGVAGELVLAGAGLARGYLGHPGLTAERFVPDPFSATPGVRLYRTGDLVRRRPDGGLEFLGRRDDQVKVRGVRIELGEIEAALESHPAIGAAAALVRDDPPGERRLVAYLVPRPGREIPAAEELRSFLADRLPEAMLPTAMVELAALPLTPSGKLDRRALPAPAVERRLARELVAPGDPVELELVKIWEEVLAVR